MRGVRRPDGGGCSTVALKVAHSSFAMLFGVPLVSSAMQFLRVCRGPVRAFLSFVLVAGPAFLNGQTSDGFRATEKGGVALVKPQAWSPDDQISVVEFLSFTDRSVKTSPGAGYFELRTAKNPNVQIAAARIVKLIVFPDAPKDLTEPAQRADLQKMIDEFEGLSTRVPEARSAIAPSLALLKAEAAKYDGGSVKEDGVWVPRTVYFKKKAGALVELLKTEMTESGNIRSFDLENNQYFLGLQDLAAAEKSVQPMVAGVQSLFGSMKRQAERSAVMTKLRAPGLDRAGAEELVAQLNRLQPAEDKEAAAFLQSWNSAIAGAGNVTRLIEEAQAAFENGLTIGDDKVPVVPGDVADKVRLVAASLDQFRAGHPPVQIKVPAGSADAMSACVARLPSVGTQMKARQFLEAKSILDPLVEQAPSIGPKTVAALAGVQSVVTTQIERFQALRNEAKMLADSDKIEQAIKKYEEAFAVIPDKDLTARIEALKKQ